MLFSWKIRFSFVTLDGKSFYTVKLLKYAGKCHFGGFLQYWVWLIMDFMCFNFTNRNSLYNLWTSVQLLGLNLNERVSVFRISQHFTVEKSSYLWKVQLHQKVGWTKQVRQEALLLCKELLFDPHAGKKGKEKGAVQINLPHQIIEDAFAPVSLFCINVWSVFRGW